MARIGRMRHRVKLQAPASPETQDTGGAYTPSYVDQVTVWAEVRTLSGSEQAVTVLDTSVASVIHRVQIRKPATLPKETWLVVWVDEGVTRTLEVKSVLEPDNRGRIVVLECVEVVL